MAGSHHFGTPASQNHTKIGRRPHANRPIQLVKNQWSLQADNFLFHSDQQQHPTKQQQQWWRWWGIASLHDVVLDQESYTTWTQDEILLTPSHQPLSFPFPVLRITVIWFWFLRVFLMTITNTHTHTHTQQKLFIYEPSNHRLCCPPWEIFFSWRWAHYFHTHQLRRAPSDTTYSFGTPFGASKKSPLDE